MSEPTYRYGRLFCEDGVRPVLMKREKKFFQAFYVDGTQIIRRYVMFDEEKYFIEWANSNTDLKRIKQIARRMRGKNLLSDTKREMSNFTKNVLDEIRGLK